LFVVAVLIDVKTEWLVATPIELAVALGVIWRFKCRQWKS
jgi:hypothetical protein